MENSSIVSLRQMVWETRFAAGVKYAEHEGVEVMTTAE